MVQPVYHAVATAPLYVLAAVCAAELWRQRPARTGALRAATALVLAGGLAWLGADSLRELFFQWHMDTRRMGAAWIAENVPRSFQVRKNRYALEWQEDESGSPTPAGTLYMRSGLDADPGVPGDAIALKRFLLERAPLTQFRNVREETFVGAPALLRPGFTLPAGPRWPSQTGNQMIFDNGREFVRSEKLFVLAAGDALVRWLVTDAPLREAWVVAQAGASPVEVAVSFGGTARTLGLGAGAAALVHLERPPARFPSGGGLYFYRLSLEKPTGPARVLLATAAGEAGRFLFAAGRYADAAVLLERAAREEGSPAAAALALIAARRAGGAAAPPDAATAALARRAGSVTDDDSLFAAFGIRAAYLDALPFLSLSADDLESNGYTLLPRKSVVRSEGPRDLVPLPKLWERHLQKGYLVGTPGLMLDPGHYRASVRLRALRGRPAIGELRALLTDAGEKETFAEQRLAVPALTEQGYATVDFDLVVPQGAAAVKLLLKADGPPNLAIGGIELRPDTLANARALAAALQAAAPGN
jgi:hypothetical protein